MKTYPSTDSTLTVYKASAGSGKTFTLALEYIKLLMVNPFAFEGILAVTFTNKATEEMKMRILSTLYDLWKQLPAGEGYMKAIMADLTITEEEVRRNSERALRYLLHNYQSFRVETIDSFFQSVLRNLARELQLGASLKVGLNNDQVVEEAVDGMIDTLADDHDLMRFVKGYMEERMEDEKSWNVIAGLKKFGGTIFQELYKKNRKRMDAAFSDPNFFDRYKETMRNILKTTPMSYTQRGKEVLKAVEENGLTVEDFSNKASGPIGYFVKLSNGQFHLPNDKLLGARVTVAREDATAWSTKTSKKRDTIIAFAEGTLIPAIREIEESRSDDAILYRSAKATLAHINDVRLLRRIEEEAHNLNEAAQRFMLSDTQSLLHNIIGDDDTPFVFEKIGTRLNHLMIDEFQDTSTVQWANFRILLRECMSQGNSNLIVGDVKQSIYRFRAGDWQLLNDIDKEFSANELTVKQKTVNWRSQRNIVHFNNAFFSLAVQIEALQVAEYSQEKADSIIKAYSDVKQAVPPHHDKDEGLVHIEMLPKKDLDTMEQRVLQTILDLTARGVSPQDITILTRNKKDISTIAKYIESNSHIKVVSAEAFRLDSSPAVQVIISAMKLLSNPSDDIAAATISRYAPTALKYIEDSYKQLSSMTLHNLAHHLLNLLPLESTNNEGAYISSLFDQIHSFCQNATKKLTTTQMDDFLKAWEEEFAAKTIESTSHGDRIRIMTIHKSKGLEFPHVILPYCNWKCDPPHTTIWTTPTKQPFSQMPILPLDYRTVNSLQGTIYEADGIEEHIQTVVDNLNLLYVAMTRAEQSLFIIGERTTKTFSPASTICKTLQQMETNSEANATGSLHIEGLKDSDDTLLTITYGRLTPHSKVEKGQQENPFNTTPQGQHVTISPSDILSNITFRQSNESSNWAMETKRYQAATMGEVLHQVFSSIHTLDDIEPVLQQMETSKVIEEEAITDIDTLRKTINQSFQNEQAQWWFHPRWTVYCEQTIVTPQGETLRPDRVITDGEQTIVIDYKFGKPLPHHHQQVSQYANLLTKMGMPNVTAYLWYVSDNSIVEVERT